MNNYQKSFNPSTIHPLAMIPKVISARHRGDMGDRLRGVSGHCGALWGPCRGRGGATSWQEGAHENGERGGLSGCGNAAPAPVQRQVPWPSLSPSPAGAGAAGLQPRSHGWGPTSPCAHVVSGRSTSARGEGPGLIRLRRARLTGPRLGQTTGKGRGHREGQGTQGGAGQADENS